MTDTEREKRQLRCGRYAIALLTAVLHNTEVPPLPEGLRWQQVYETTRQHSVEAMVFSAVEPLVRTEPELYAVWKGSCDQDMAQTLTQMSEEPRLLGAFSGAGLRALPVKGGVLRAMYPSPGFRQMSDIDLILPPEEMEQAAALLASLGYQAPKVDFAQEHEASFCLPPFLSVELHDSPVKPDDPRAGYYRDIWSRAVPDPGWPGIFRLRTEDEYLYLLVHFLQHYEDAGIGIRQVMDVYVFLQAEKSRMDEAYLAKEAEKMGITSAREAIEALAEYCFSGQTVQPDPELDEMMEFCILSGAYGSHRSRSLSIMRKAQQAETKRGWKLRYILRRIFPPAEELYRRYPSARRAPWLLPLCWLRRLLNVSYWKEHFRSEMASLTHAQKKN